MLPGIAAVFCKCFPVNAILNVSVTNDLFLIKVTLIITTTTFSTEPLSVLTEIRAFTTQNSVHTLQKPFVCWTELNKLFTMQQSIITILIFF